jgi:membrane fusion protein, multidrug efflux system
MATSAPSSLTQTPVPGTAAPEASGTTVPARASRKRVFLIAGAVVVVAAASAYWVHSQKFEDTDDAAVDGTISNVSPRVSGTVISVSVIENQPVKEGDVIAEIDPTDLKIALAQAKAELAQARAQLAAEDPNVPIILATNVSAVASAQSDVAGAQAALSAAKSEVQQLTAQLAQATANDRQAQLEKNRSQALVAQGAVSQSDFDQHNNAAVATAANVDAIAQSLAAARDRVTQQQAQIVAIGSRYTEIKSNAPRQVATRQASLDFRQAALELAQAQEDQAEKNLQYAKILAPVTGIVAKKSIAIGDHVAPGQQVVAITQTDSLWVTANFRETQLERMRPGQTASMHIDAVGETVNGTVESIGGATGSRLSVLPPENASGNYVKVVQRIPVRLRFDSGQAGLDRLRIGMSVEPTVTVR